ncbi:MAG: alpha/beta hydrolase [Microbacterium sp.]
MDVIMVPGLWLDASSWDAVIPAIEAAGHRPRPLTMPGVGAPAEESADIGIDDWVRAVVAEIDALDAPVVLIGHSGGGNVVWGAADRRRDRVARVIFLDTWPPGDGHTISEFPVVDGVIPFPGWDFFDDMDVSDLDDETRADAATRTSSVPARVPTDPLRLTDPQRRSVPATMITNTVPAAEVRGIIEAAPDWAAELASIEDLEIIQIVEEDEKPGHWPQFSKPERTAEAIVAALR